MSSAIVAGSEFIGVSISSNVSQVASEKKFAAHLTVSELKGKLEMITGASMATMKIELFNIHNTSIGKLDNDNAVLRDVLVSGVRLHVTDKAAMFDDLANVEKFEISQEAYEAKEDTVQAFKKRNKLGRFNPEAQAKAALVTQENTDRAAAMKVGDRCQTAVPNAPIRRGAVVFVGETDFKAGHWIGVQYDEPVGKHDGLVEGKRYFKCQDKYGGFCQPRHVTVGDFPPELDFSDDEI